MKRRSLADKYPTATVMIAACVALAGALTLIAIAVSRGGA
jgi:hypothetical protein